MPIKANWFKVVRKPMWCLVEYKEHTLWYHAGSCVDSKTVYSGTVILSSESYEEIATEYAHFIKNNCKGLVE